MVTLCHQSKMSVRKLSRSTLKTKDSCAIPHFSSHKLKIEEFSNAKFYKLAHDPENIYTGVMVSDESLIQDYIETNEYTETAEHIMRLQKAQAVAFIADAWELTLVPCV